MLHQCFTRLNQTGSQCVVNDEFKAGEASFLPFGVLNVPGPGSALNMEQLANLKLAGVELDSYQRGDVILLVEVGKVIEGKASVLGPVRNFSHSLGVGRIFASAAHPDLLFQGGSLHPLSQLLRYLFDHDFFTFSYSLFCFIVIVFKIEDLVEFDNDARRPVFITKVRATEISQSISVRITECIAVVVAEPPIGKSISIHARAVSGQRGIFALRFISFEKQGGSVCPAFPSGYLIFRLVHSEVSFPVLVENDHGGVDVVVGLGGSDTHTWALLNAAVVLLPIGGLFVDEREEDDKHQGPEASEACSR